MPGDKINVKLSFNQAVSLIGNKNLTLKIGESKVTLRPITESNAREFTFEGSKTDLEQIIGNAVPVELAAYVGRHLLDYMNDCLVENL